jgi:hypothetical protein
MKMFISSKLTQEHLELCHLLPKLQVVPIAKIATRLMLGQTFSDLRDHKVLLQKIFHTENIMPTDRISVKAPVLPFSSFPNVDAVLRTRDEIYW